MGATEAGKLCKRNYKEGSGVVEVIWFALRGNLIPHLVDKKSSTRKQRNCYGIKMPLFYLPRPLAVDAQCNFL